jgi:3-oxoacyl-[acyl-carrier protein] reductase
MDTAAPAKRVLVTGGSRGLGLAICRRLASDGWSVMTASRRVSTELKELMSAYPGRVEHYPCDFADPEACRGLADAARLLDGLEGFVANAAVGTEGLLTLTSEAAVRECVQVNLLAPMLLAREVVKGMLGRGGSLVFVSSVAALTGFSGLAAYGACKGGLISFSRALAREYGERGIRSNSVLPGYLQTEMSATLDSESRERIVRRTALKRLGQVDDVVGTVAFLLSGEARYITGSEIVVDGGLRA